MHTYTSILHFLLEDGTYFCFKKIGVILTLFLLLASTSIIISYKKYIIFLLLWICKGCYSVHICNMNALLTMSSVRSQDKHAFFVWYKVIHSLKSFFFFFCYWVPLFNLTLLKKQKGARVTEKNIKRRKYPRRRRLVCLSETKSWGRGKYICFFYC